MKFLTLTARMQLNVHDLNNEAVAGNVSDIRVIDYVDAQGKRREAPAVSGRMLKHWHLEAMRTLAIEKDLPLCAACRAGEPMRPGTGEPGKLEQDAPPERDALAACAVCDVHGYLIAKPPKDAAQKGVSQRRNSRAMFSWLLPVLHGPDGEPESVSKQVVHTRVSQEREREAGEAAAQMLFYKAYGSGVYGFVSALDVDRIGRTEAQNEPAEGVSAAERIRLAIEAYRYLLSGRLGASMSHAVPHADCQEVLAAYRTDGPLPLPVSAIYEDYAAKYAGLLPEGSVLLAWGLEDPPEGAQKLDSVGGLLDHLLQQVEG